MTRSFVAAALLGALAVCAPADEKDKDKGEQEALAELKKLAVPLPREAADLDTEEIKEEYEKRAKRALELITKYEADYPKSKSLDDARLLALKAISHSYDLATAKEPLALAKRLREATQKGSDHAAQA